MNTQLRKNSRRSVASCVFAVALLFAAGSTAAAQCSNSDALSSVAFSGFVLNPDGTVSGTFKNNSPTCTHEIGIASYMIDQTNIFLDAQVYVDSATAVLAPGQSVTLTIDAPDCAYQVDAFVGDAILKFAGSDYYAGRLFYGRMYGCFCVPEEPKPRGCTRTQGYWKNHEEAWCVQNLTLGTVNYNQQQLLSILRQPVRGNGLVSLTRQLIAAKLNIACGASAPQSVLSAINAADAMIGSRVIPPVGSGYIAPSETSSLTSILDEYNNGRSPGGPSHCN